MNLKVRSPKRGATPPLFALVVLVIRLALDLVTLVLRAVVWLLEHVCRRLERCITALSPTVPTAPVRPTPAVSRTPRAPRSEPVPLSELDKLAAKLWEPSRGKPSPDTYAMAERILASTRHRSS